MRSRASHWNVINDNGHVENWHREFTQPWKDSFWFEKHTTAEWSEREMRLQNINPPQYIFVSIFLSGSTVNVSKINHCSKRNKVWKSFWLLGFLLVHTNWMKPNFCVRQNGFMKWWGQIGCGKQTGYFPTVITPVFERIKKVTKGRSALVWTLSLKLISCCLSSTSLWFFWIRFLTINFNRSFP